MLFLGSLASHAYSCDPSGWLHNIVHDGDNLHTFTSKGASACCASCAGNATCASWSFESADPDVKATCYLHGGSSKTKPKENRIAGFKAHTQHKLRPA